MFNFSHEIPFTTIWRYHKETSGVNTDSRLRFYKSSPTRCTLQVRGPENVTKGLGKYGVVASADLNLAELELLSDAINTGIALLKDKNS